MNEIEDVDLFFSKNIYDGTSLMRKERYIAAHPLGRETINCCVTDYPVMHEARWTLIKSGIFLPYYTWKLDSQWEPERDVKKPSISATDYMRILVRTLRVLEIPDEA